MKSRSRSNKGSRRRESSVELRVTDSLEDAGHRTSSRGRPLRQPLAEWRGEGFVWRDGELSGVRRAVSSDSSRPDARREQSRGRSRSRRQASSGATGTARQQIRDSSSPARPSIVSISSAEVLESSPSRSSGQGADDGDDVGFQAGDEVAGLLGAIGEDADESNADTASHSNMSVSSSDDEAAVPDQSACRVPRAVARAIGREQVAYKRIFEAESEGRWSLVEAVWDREWDYHKAVFAGHTESGFHDMAMQSLLAMSDDLLRAILDGNLQLAKRRNGDLAEELSTLWQRGEHQLCHYMLELVDPETGEAPLPPELWAIVVLLREYLGVAKPKDFEKIRAIESFKHSSKFDEEAMRDGVRLYLPSDRSRRVLEDLLQRLHDACEAEAIENDDWGEPWDRTMRYVGYGKDGISRIKSHKAHRSNYLMGLFEAASAALGFPYRNVPEVISLCFEKGQAAFGEILWSCLGSSYCKTGFGYNHTPAGMSNDSATQSDMRLLGDKDRAEWYDHVWQQTPYQTNRVKEQAKLRDIRAEEASLTARIKALRNSKSSGAELAMPESLPEDRWADTEFESEEQRKTMEDRVKASLLARIKRCEALDRLKQRLGSVAATEEESI